MHCPEWCEEDHGAFQLAAEFGSHHRSRAVEVPAENPECPLFVRVEGWFENGDWNEAVSIGRRGEDGTWLTAGNAVRLGLALIERAKDLPSLADDSAATHLVAGNGGEGEEEPDRRG
jgi:hypothetical protein